MVSLEEQKTCRSWKSGTLLLLVGQSLQVNQPRGHCQSRPRGDQQPGLTLAHRARCPNLPWRVFPSGEGVSSPLGHPGVLPPTERAVLGWPPLCLPQAVGISSPSRERETPWLLGSFRATFRSWAAHASSVGLGHSAPGSTLFHTAPPPIKPPKETQGHPLCCVPCPSTLLLEAWDVPGLFLGCSWHFSPAGWQPHSDCPGVSQVREQDLTHPHLSILPEPHRCQPSLSHLGKTSPFP